MVRFALAIAIALLSGTTSAADVQKVLGLWGSQGGPWEGYIEIFGPGSPEPQTVALSTRWDAVPDHSIVTKIETFTGPDRETSAVTLMFEDAVQGDIVTPYFINGKQRDFHFSVVSVAIVDETHWTTVIASPNGQEIYEDRPAELRYVRIRNGNVIENTKDVRFLDEEGNGDYERRSFIRQTLAPE